MKKILAGMAVCAMFAVPTQAEAALVTLWDFTVETEWTAATFGGSGTAGVTTFTPSELSWGAAGGTFDAAAGNTRSALVISQSPESGQMTTNGGPEATNVITHYNNRISNTFETLTSGQLTTTLHLTPNTPPGPAFPPDARVFNFDFIETQNADTPEECGFESNTNCDDIFVVQLGNLVDSFFYDGVVYTISILELSGNLGALTDAQCAAAGVESGCVGLRTNEGAATPLNFAIQITGREVPEPTTLALMGLGLLGAGVIRRRRA